jgi:hypothetical protein
VAPAAADPSRGVMVRPQVAPRFRGKLVVLDYHPSIREAPMVNAAVNGLVRRLEDEGGTEADLLDAIPELVAQYGGLVARLTGVDDDSIEFTVTRH